MFIQIKLIHIVAFQIIWLHEFYRRDFEDPYIRMALAGKVLQKNFRGYMEIEGAKQF